MSKTKRFFQLFFVLLGIVAFTSLLVLAGESDLDKLEMNQIYIRGFGAVATLILARVGHAVVSRKENDESEMR